MVAQPGPNRFKLKLPSDCRIHDTFHVSRLKPWTDPDVIKMKKKKIPLPTAFKGKKNEYNVERILETDFSYGIRWYLVHWKGYDEIKDSTWEPEENLTHAKKLVEEFKKQHGIDEEDKTKQKPKKQRQKR